MPTQFESRRNTLRYCALRAGCTRKVGHTGAVTLAQRFGGALNANAHFHMRFLDGVYVDGAHGLSARFQCTKAPTSAERWLQRVKPDRPIRALDIRRIEKQHVEAVIRSIIGLERMGYEAEVVGRMAIRLAQRDPPKGQYRELWHLGNLVKEIVHNALDTFARTDVEAAVSIRAYDREVDQEHESIMR